MSRNIKQSKKRTLYTHCTTSGLSKRASMQSMREVSKGRLQLRVDELKNSRAEEDGG